jgi:AcrR family transcriptional regulator
MDRPVHRDKEGKIGDLKQAFTQLVMADGYESVTIRQIARRVNVSVGLIYHYFPGGKPTIAAAIYKDDFHKTIIPYTVTGEPETIEKVCRMHLDKHREHIALYKMFDQVLLTEQDAWKGLKSDRNDMFRRYARESGIPADRIEAWLLACSTVDTLIHRHLTMERLTDSETEFIHLIRVVYTSIIEEM